MLAVAVDESARLYIGQFCLRRVDPFLSSSVFPFPFSSARSHYVNNKLQTARSTRQKEKQSADGARTRQRQAAGNAMKVDRRYRGLFWSLGR